MIVPVKCLTDIVPNPEDDEFGHSLVDLKTARSAEHRCWTKSVFENDYHVQAAMNLDCLNAVPGAFQRDMFRHLIVENFKPWEPAGRWLTQEYIDLDGRNIWARSARTVVALRIRSGRATVIRWRLTMPDTIRARRCPTWCNDTSRDN